jgi:hypothetical protein
MRIGKRAAMSAAVSLTRTVLSDPHGKPFIMPV